MQNYFKDSTGWERSISLNRLCSEQRERQLRNLNPNFRGRKKAVISSYFYYLKQGKSKEEAYQAANRTQLIHIVPKPGTIVNIDARTSWTLEIEGTWLKVAIAPSNSSQLGIIKVNAPATKIKSGGAVNLIQIGMIYEQ